MIAVQPLAATPQSTVVTWSVALPAARPLVVHRSLDSGATWAPLTTISEAWTSDTFADATVPANVFPLYAAAEE